MRFKRKKRAVISRHAFIDVDNLLKDTTGLERFNVFDFAASLRKYFAALLLVCASLSAVSSVIVILNAQPNLSILASIAILCAANIAGGLFLLSLE